MPKVIVVLAIAATVVIAAFSAATTIAYGSLGARGGLSVDDTNNSTLPSQDFLGTPTVNVTTVPMLYDDSASWFSNGCSYNGSVPYTVPFPSNDPNATPGTQMAVVNALGPGYGCGTGWFAEVWNFTANATLVAENDWFNVTTNWTLSNTSGEVVGVNSVSVTVSSETLSTNGTFSLYVEFPGNPVSLGTTNVTVEAAPPVSVPATFGGNGRDARGTFPPANVSQNFVADPALEPQLVGEQSTIYSDAVAAPDGCSNSVANSTPGVLTGIPFPEPGGNYEQALFANAGEVSACSGGDYGMLFTFLVSTPLSAENDWFNVTTTWVTPGGATVTGFSDSLVSVVPGNLPGGSENALLLVYVDYGAGTPTVLSCSITVQATSQVVVVG
ncbi:MAG TPA: hypothetical protein VGG32_06830 [Thermoplasmata archaeon]|jgi:hypothetical protein